MVTWSTYPFLWCLIAEVKSCGVPIHSNTGISNESPVFPQSILQPLQNLKGGKTMYWGKNNYEGVQISFIKIILPGNSLVVQWLGLGAYTTMSQGFHLWPRN